MSRIVRSYLATFTSPTTGGDPIQVPVEGNTPCAAQNQAWEILERDYASRVGVYVLSSLDPVAS